MPSLARVATTRPGVKEIGDMIDIAATPPDGESPFPFRPWKGW